MKIPRHVNPPRLSPPIDDPNLYGVNFTLQVNKGEDLPRVMATIMRAIVHDSDRRDYVLRLAREVKANAKKRATSPAVAKLSNDLDVPACSIAQLIELHEMLGKAQIFTRDPKSADMPRHVDQLAFEILETGRVQCDCDCLAMLGAAIARFLGFETAFVLVGDTPTDRFRHVFYAAKLRNHWHPFDPQTKTRPFVWPTRAVRREIIPLDLES